mmetsp:Transcript_19583/g.44834  ORF Transcript_19583/g.44834 Transcript_19583/m.44834 type:complete len:252 (-) Transcript_19583:200-955(-)
MAISVEGAFDAVGRGVLIALFLADILIGPVALVDVRTCWPRYGVQVHGILAVHAVGANSRGRVDGAQRGLRTREGRVVHRLRNRQGLSGERCDDGGQVGAGVVLVKGQINEFISGLQVWAVVAEQKLRFGFDLVECFVQPIAVAVPVGVDVALRHVVPGAFGIHHLARIDSMGEVVLYRAVSRRRAVYLARNRVQACHVVGCRWAKDLVAFAGNVPLHRYGRRIAADPCLAAPPRIVDRVVDLRVVGRRGD